MKTSLLPILAAFVLGSCAGVEPRSEVSPALRAEFAPSGTLVAAINYGNAVIMQRPKEGDVPQGVGPEMARELAKRLGVPIRYVTFESAREAVDAVGKGRADVTFVAVDPARAQEVAFSAPYVDIDGTYLVPKDSPFRKIEDLDVKGLTVAVGEKSAYDLYLTRTFRNAQLMRVPTSGEALEAGLTRRAGASAGVRQLMESGAKRDPSFRVIEGSFMTIAQAMCVPKARQAAARYLGEFVEEMKASGFVAQHLARTRVQASVSPSARKP